MADDQRGRERRLRTAAERQGLTLHRSRRRDRQAAGRTGYMLSDSSTSGLVVLGDSPTTYSATLDDVEKYLVNE
jgi:hypothetical protein